jgi:hypothetical protein
MKMESDKDDSLSLSRYKIQKPSAVDGSRNFQDRRFNRQPPIADCQLFTVLLR